MIYEIVCVCVDKNTCVCVHRCVRVCVCVDEQHVKYLNVCVSVCVDHAIQHGRVCVYLS